MRERDPGKKKRATLKRERRYAYGNSPHARGTAGSRRDSEHQYRQRLRRATELLGGGDERGEWVGSGFRSVRVSRWSKEADVSLQLKLKLRELRRLEGQVRMCAALDPPLEVRLAGRLRAVGMHPVQVEQVCRQVIQMVKVGAGYSSRRSEMNGYGLGLLRLLNRVIGRMALREAGRAEGGAAARHGS